MSELRRKMSTDLRNRNDAERTRGIYITRVAEMARHFGRSPDRMSPGEVRDYPSYLTAERGVSRSAYVQTVAALRFLYQVALFGFSRGGWVVPTAAAAAPDEIAFTIIGSGPAVPLSEELLYSSLTGDDRCMPSGLSYEEIERRLDEATPSGFDPVPYLERMESPGLWVCGALDTSVPVQRSVANLDRIASELDKDFTVILLPDANHEWIVGGAMCQATGRGIDANVLFDWLLPRLHRGGGHGEDEVDRHV